MNSYTTLSMLKSVLKLSVTTYDTLLSELMEISSREVDDICGRQFYVETDTRYFDPPERGAVLIVDDLLSVTSIAQDTDDDLDYTDEVWDSGDYLLLPHNEWPKTRILLHPNGDYFWGSVPKGVKVVGSFGFGDGETASPWTTTAITCTVATTDGMSVTVSADGTLLVGHTILVGSEQMYVSGTATGTITVTRGVNGTTAAIHSAAAASVAKYPAVVGQATRLLAAQLYKTQATQEMLSERIGNYSYTRATSTEYSRGIQRFLGPYQRVVF